MASTDMNDSLNNCNNVDNSGNNFVSQDNLMGNATILIDSPKYGFANKVSGILTAFEVCFCTLFFVTLNFVKFI